MTGWGVKSDGQLAIANADKKGAKAILIVCDDAQKKALEEARKKTRTKFLGVF